MLRSILVAAGAVSATIAALAGVVNATVNDLLLKHLEIVRIYHTDIESKGLGKKPEPNQDEGISHENPGNNSLFNEELYLRSHGTGTFDRDWPLAPWETKGKGPSLSE